MLDKEAKYSLIPKLYKNFKKNKIINVSNPNEKYNNILSIKDLSKFVLLLCSSKTKLIKKSFPIAAKKPIKLIEIVKIIKKNLRSTSNLKIVKPNDICRSINSYRKNFKFETDTVAKTLNTYFLIFKAF